MSDLAEELEGLGGDITTALEGVRVHALLLDGAGIIRWQNRAAKKFAGDRVGSHVVEAVAPAERERFRELLARILCEGEPAEFTLHVEDASGETVAIDVSSAPVRGDGSVVGIFGLVRTDSGPSDGEGRQTGELPPELTPRQFEVLNLLAAGRSTGEIASDLHLSRTTVRNYVAGILAALGVHTRLQAVLVAKERRLIA